MPSSIPQKVVSLEAENKKMKFDIARLKVDMQELAQIIVDMKEEKKETKQVIGSQEIEMVEPAQVVEQPVQVEQDDHKGSQAIAPEIPEDAFIDQKNLEDLFLTFPESAPPVEFADTHGNQANRNDQVIEDRPVEQDDEIEFERYSPVL